MKMSQLVQQLSVHPTYNTWRELSEIVLSRLVVFNKRRGSEPAKLLLQNIRVGNFLALLYVYCILLYVHTYST